MSYAMQVSPSSKLSDRLTGPRVRELAALILKSSYPSTGQSVVQPLLELLVAGEFDLRENFLIREPSVVLLLLELLPKLSDQLQLELWRTLGDILTQSLSNIHACRGLHLIERCLDQLRRTNNDKVAVHIVRVMEIVGGYSISLKELRDILSYLYTGHQESWAPHSVPLVRALTTMATHNQPEVFFTFAGTPGAAITLPPISKWPSEFSIQLWLRLEKPYDCQRDYYKPVVYWFRTSRPEHGYSSHFIGNKLIIETFGRGQKRPQTHALDMTFAPYRWYMLSVVYVYHRVKSSSLTVFVDGGQVLTTDVTLPNTSAVYDKCFLGTSPSATEDVLFQGQLSAVYLFREPLKHDTVTALHRLGPSYKSQFRFEAECDVPLTPQQKKLLFDGRLSSAVCFSYNAKAVDGQLCLEASPNENTSPFTHSPHATLLEGVDPVVTTPFHTVLHSLGGVQALFPLFSQLDLPQSGSTTPDPTLSVKVLRVMFELAKGSTSCLHQLEHLKALRLLTYLLRKASPVHLSHELVSLLFEFARYLGNAPHTKELLSQLIELLTSDLWTLASVKLQTYLYSGLASEMGSRVLGRSGLLLPELVTVPRLMYTLREHYRGAPGVRPYLLLLIKDFILTGVSQSEAIESILDYLNTQQEDGGDVVELVLALLFEQQQGTMVGLFQQAGGINVAIHLLTCSTERIRLQALKIIGKVLHSSTHKQQRLLVESHGLWAAIRGKLLATGQPVTMAMFNALFELMVNCPSRRIIDSHYIALDLSHQIWFPEVLPLLVEAVVVLHTSQIDGDVAMTMQLLSYISSLCAQEPNNCKAVVGVMGWQRWLLTLEEHPGASEADQRILEEMVHSLLLSILSHCFQAEQDGWRAWVQTTAALHLNNPSQEFLGETADSLAFTALDSTTSTSSIDQARTDELVHEPGSANGPTSDEPPRDDVPLSSTSPDKPPLVDEKIPPFHWTPRVTRLLADLIKNLCSYVNKGISDRSRSALSEFIEQHKYLRSNVAQLLALTSDCVLELCGGLEHLYSLATPTSNKEKESPVPSTAVQALLGGCLELCEVFVLSGLLRLTPVEARMKMETGGALRQGLRLVMAAANIASHKTHTKYKEFHAGFHREKASVDSLHKDCLSTLKTLGLTGSSLEKYFDSTKQHKLRVIRSCQCLLSDKYVSLLMSAIPGDGERKALTQQTVAVIFYYLSSLCVYKYRRILEAIKSEEKKALVKQPSRQSIAPNTKPLQHKTGTGAVDSSRESSPEGGQGLALHSRALDISEQIEASMTAIGPCLCGLLVEHKGHLSKLLVCADGRALLTDAVIRLSEGTRAVELTMLLCSQDWQRCLKGMRTRLFAQLMTEGKSVSRFSESYIQSVGSQLTSDLEASLKEQCRLLSEADDRLSVSQTDAGRRCEREGQGRKAEAVRHSLSAKELWRKISSVVDETGSYDNTPLRESRYWRLDLRESHHRQRLQLLANQSGTSHTSATRSHDSTPPSHPPLPTPLTPPPRLDIDPESLTDELTDSLDDAGPHSLSLSCVMVVLAHALPGTLVLSRRALSFTPDDSTQEYKSAAHLMECLELSGEWLISDVRAAFSRRYLHQSKALELFLHNRTSVFFVFESSKDVKTVLRKLPKVGVGCEYGLPQTRAVSLATPQQLFRKSSMTTRWVHREINNYQYLVYLNTVAGRTYSDLNQYPVFPWILADYTSKQIDLSDPSIYRDLTKPIGALNESRLRSFEERFEGFTDDRIPPFHYGTHYSTMAFVLHWLVRVEPFSSLHISFHDGMFDHSARLFNCVAEAWTNTNRDSSNVNELIPEFYHLPEMLLNQNKFDLGREGSCGEGPIISDVKLPPWAESAHEFVRINREALESEYVSSHLHHWMDLIFGYKQRGEAAVEARNVFYYLTYAGAVDLDAVTDTKMRKGLEEQIRQFGQTPAQLLTEPHPARLPLPKELPPQPAQGLNPRDPALLAELQVTPDVPLALVQYCSPTLLVVSSNQLCALNKFIVTPGISGGPATVVLDPDPSIGAGLRTRLGDPLDGSVSASSACFATPPDCHVIFVCGFWDNSFKSFATDSSGKMLQSVFGHMGIVTCVDFSPECGLHGNQGDGLIATGSHDATVLLWRWCGRLNRVVGVISDSQGVVSPVAVLTGHEQSVACVSLCSTLGLVVSVAAKYGYCLVHSCSGELLHKVTPSAQWMHPHLVCLTPDGHFVVHYADQKGCLALFTCNGQQLSHHTLDEPTLALAVTKDGRYVITGGFDCRVKVFSAHNMRLQYSHKSFDSSIRSLHISEDQKFIFAGLASGTVAVLTTHYWLQ